MAAGSDGSPILQDNQTFDSPSSIREPRSPILAKFSGSFSMERGPRYKEYSALRERRIRMKNMAERRTPEKERVEMLQDRPVLTPQKKQVKFQGNLNAATPPKKPKRPSVLTQSVPDFSAVVRKENRRPIAALPPVAERWATPPAAVCKGGGIWGNSGGSKSTNSAEKRRGGLMAARKSYASIDELKGVGAAAGNAIDRENRGRISRVIGKTF